MEPRVLTSIMWVLGSCSKLIPCNDAWLPQVLVQVLGLYSGFVPLKGKKFCYPRALCLNQSIGT